MSVRDSVLRDRRAGPPAIRIHCDSIPLELKAIPRWNTWAWRWNGKKFDKPPLRFDGDAPGSSTNPATWGAFRDVLETHRTKGLGIGFVLNGDGIVGVDFDDCREPQTGEIATWARDLVKMLASYTEISPSGTGLKTFVRGSLPAGTKSAYEAQGGRGQVEFYASGRYFTVTGDLLAGTPAEVCERPELLGDVCSIVSAWNGRGSGINRPDTPHVSTCCSSDRETALAALSVLDPGMPYPDWIKVAQALHATDPSLLGEFDAWSRGCPDKYIEGEPAAKWSSFRASGGVALGTLCFMADETGQRWRSEKPRNGHFVRPQAGHDSRITPESIPNDTGATPIIVPRFRTFAQLRLAHPQMRPALIEPLVRQGETVNIIANPKFGKSFLSMSIALAVQTGLPWLGRFPVMQGAVLLIDNELHPETIVQRLAATAAGYGIQPSAWENELCIESLRGNLIDINAMSAYFQHIEKDRFQSIILDAKYRFTPRGADENSNADEQRFYNLLDQFADRTGAAFFLIHHANKGGQRGKSVTDVGAGAGAQSRAADTHIVLRPPIITVSRHRPRIPLRHQRNMVATWTPAGGT